MTHHNTGRRIRLGDYKLEDLKFECRVDGMRFVRQEDIGDHLRKNHRYTDAQMQAYYDQHHKQAGEGACLWCGSPTRFQSIGMGYAKFCHNTDCNVCWHNKHEGRAVKAGPAIQKTMASGDKIPSQLGYWLAKGLNLEQAQARLKYRQSTNSVAAIMKREGCTRVEAESRRKAITDKWSEKVHTGQAYSEVSQKLFWAVWEHVRGVVGVSDCFFATFNKGQKGEDGANLEFRLETARSYVRPDFYIPPLQVLIEFDGEWYHSGYWRPDYSDKQRDADILEKYPQMHIHHVRERDYMKNSEDVIQGCVKAIYARLANR